jgi:hypothetical protein
MARIRFTLTAVIALAVPVALASCSASDGERTSDSQADQAALNAVPQHPHKEMCGAVRQGGMRCHAKVRIHPDGTVQQSATPSGWGPSDLRSAYKLPTSGGNGRIIAIVDAYDDPTAEADLAVYRTQYGLPPCTTSNGCFKKVNQNGVQGSYPQADSGWSGEIALDLDMASAACPDCKIILVEASSATDQDLGISVNTAVSLGAAVVSNSYGGPEDSSVTTSSSQYFNHPGVAIMASSGDGAYGVEFPAASQYVIAVGGTKLAKSTSTRGWAESAWTSAGSGCSKYIPKPSWQTDTGCSKRTVADVSAVADPNTGVAVYQGGSWQVYGGTSVSSPLVAGIYALLGLNGTNNASYAYSHTADFYDVTSGSNGSCGGSYLCTAMAGYDGPTGLGTPNGSLLSGGGGGTPDSGGGTPDSGGPVDSGSPDTGGGTPDSGGGSTCAHPICTSGTKLTSTCDPCATKICAQDSYCCSNQWDSVCVGEVASICGETCGGGGGGDAGTGDAGGGGGGTCSHPICSTGAKLTASCSTCATKVCAQDSYCCNTLWDNICVGEVGSICGQTCP